MLGVLHHRLLVLILELVHLTGVVAEVNEALLDAPQLLNESPYEAWIAKVEDITDTEELMDAESYQAFIQK